MKYSMLTLFLLLAGLMAFPQAVRADDPLAKGKAALQQKNLPEAIAQFLEATKNNKKDPQGFILLAQAYILADSLDQATAALVQARDLDTANAEIYALQGDVYAKQNIFAGAAEQYKKAAEMKKDPALYLKLADTYRRTRQYNDAATAYLNVIALDSMNVTALRELGAIYYRAKLWPNAYSVFDRLHRLLPDSLPINIQYVRVLAENHQEKALIPIAESVLQRDQTQSDVESMLAEAYVATGQLDSAMQKYAKMNIDTMGVNNLLRYGKILKAKNDNEAAVNVYQRAFEKDSSRCDIPYDFGSLLIRVKRYGDAIGMFDRKIACDTSSGYQFASNLNIAMCQMQLKDFDDAKDHIQKSINLRPDYVQAWLMLGQDEANLEHVAAAIQAYQKVIDLGKDAEANGETGKYTRQMLEGYRYIGTQYLLQKKYKESIPYLMAALKLEPKDCQVALWIGQAYHNDNKLDEAKTWYCKVLHACPTGKEADAANKGLKLLGEECK